LAAKRAQASEKVLQCPGTLQGFGVVESDEHEDPVVRFLSETGTHRNSADKLAPDRGSGTRMFSQGADEVVSGEGTSAI